MFGFNNRCNQPEPNVTNIYVTDSYSTRKPYTTANLILDVLLTLMTGGFWLIVILIRYIGRH